VRAPGGWGTLRARRRLRAARFWYSIGDLDEAARASRHALKLARSGSGQPLLFADIALTMARVEIDRDDYATGRAHLMDVVHVLESVPGNSERDRRLAWALVALGGNYRRIGRYPPAVETLDRAVRVAETVAIAEPRALSAALTERAITAKELGEYDRAADIYAWVRQVQQNIGAGSADAATLEHNLSGLEYARGCYPVAELHARRAVDQRRRAAPDTSIEFAADLAVLAASVAAQHRHDEARTLFEQALVACRSARPPRRYEIAVQLHGLAGVEHSAGRPEQAEDRYREALSIKEELLGADHPEVGLIIGNLGTLLHQQHREPEAEQCYQRALAITEHTFGPQHPRSVRLRAKRDLLSRAAANRS
jgi:tetratricopeptide (TPR) repeat protein